jgi:hypothetical protein
VQPDQPLAVYAERRRAFGARMAVAVKDGDDPATVAKAIVAAATDAKPKLRYPAGAQTGDASTRCVAWSPRGCSTSRSASSTNSPPDRGRLLS